MDSFARYQHHMMLKWLTHKCFHANLSIFLLQLNANSQARAPFWFSLFVLSMIGLQKTTDNAEGAVEDVCAKFTAQCKGTALKHFCFFLGERPRSFIDQAMICCITGFECGFVNTRKKH